MQHHPVGTTILKRTTIIRHRMLPPYVSGEVKVQINDEVVSNKVVAEGFLPQAYKFIDIAGPLKIKPDDRDALNKVLHLDVGDEVGAGDPLAKPRRRRERKRVPRAPADSIVHSYDRGEVILQVNPQPIKVWARVPGTVTALLGEDESRGVEVRSVGALIQCVWGNGRFWFGSYSMEPEGGLISILEQDSLLSNLRERVFVLERPITYSDLRLVVQKELGGLVAPSMPYYLRETAMMLRVPILLTEGFGPRKPTPLSYEILREMENEREGAFDATMPKRSEQARPEIVLPVRWRGEFPPEPNLEQDLKPEAMVRLRREPYAGQVGRVTEIPELPQVIDNGLRVSAAQVKLQGGKQVLVPVANLELLSSSDT